MCLLSKYFLKCNCSNKIVIYDLSHIDIQKLLQNTVQFPTQKRMSRFDKFLENNIRLEVFHFTISHLVWKFWRFKNFVAPTNYFLHAPQTAGWFCGETEKILIFSFLWEKTKVPPSHAVAWRQNVPGNPIICYKKWVSPWQLVAKWRAPD